MICESATAARDIHVLAESLRHAPAGILASVNRRRAELCLPAVPTLPPTRRSTPVAEQITRVWIVACPGTAPLIRSHNLPERIEPLAWDIEQLNGPSALWGLRIGGHDGRAINTAVGTRLRAYVDPKLGLLISWMPNMADDHARRVVADIESGRRAVSICFKTLLFRHERDVHGRSVKVVTRARLDHVALLRQSERPAYRQASAWVYRGGSMPDELRRQRADAIARAMRLPKE